MARVSLRDYGRELQALKKRIQYISLDCRDGQHLACGSCGCECHGEE